MNMKCQCHKPGNPCPAGIRDRCLEECCEMGEFQYVLYRRRGIYGLDAVSFGRLVGRGLRSYILEGGDNVSESEVIRVVDGYRPAAELVSRASRKYQGCRDRMVSLVAEMDAFIRDL